MENSLLLNLLTFYEEDPEDPFNIYALALEYLKSDHQKAGHFFDLLLTKHTDYLPTYYHAGSFYTLLEEFEKAEKVYIKGIDLAIKQGNTKTHQELTRAYRGFLDEIDD